MSLHSQDSSIALENLDSHLKTILKLKLREFVHLSPCFRGIPTIDTLAYPQSGGSGSSGNAAQPDCPNRSHRIELRKRYVRQAALY